MVPPLVLPRPRPTVLPLASLTLAALTRSLLTLAALTRLPLTGTAVSPGLVSSRRGLTRRP